MVGKGGDIWALGVMVYELLTGIHPFEKTTELMTIEQIRGCKWNKKRDSLSTDAIDFLKTIFVKDEALRASACTLLDHKWLQDASLPLK